jgi:hypothetical protein
MGWAVDIPGHVPEDDFASEDSHVRPGTVRRVANNRAASITGWTAAAVLVRLDAYMQLFVPVPKFKPGDFYIF